jgi:hypothetical protein
MQLSQTDSTTWFVWRCIWDKLVEYLLQKVNFDIYISFNNQKSAHFKKCKIIDKETNRRIKTYLIKKMNPLKQLNPYGRISLSYSSDIPSTVCFFAQPQL